MLILLFFLIGKIASELDDELEIYSFITNQKKKISLYDPKIYLQPPKKNIFSNIYEKSTKDDINRKEYYYVHFSSDDVSEIQNHISLDTKGKMLKNTYLLYLSREQLQKISEMSLVKRLEPEDKIFYFGGTIEEVNYLIITTAPNASIPENIEYYTIESNWFKDTYIVRIDQLTLNNNEFIAKKQKALEILSRYPSVQRISTYKKPTIKNNLAAGYTQRNERNYTKGPDTSIQEIKRYFNELNITGQGEIITVIDTLIDFYHSMFFDQTVEVKFNQFLPNHRKLVYYGYHFDKQNWTNSITLNEHGTHVSGTAAGKNQCPSADISQGPELYDGNAPDAKILYAGLLNNVSVQEQLELMIQYQSRISTNSWGVDGYNDDINYLYGELSYLDPESIFIYAAGNDYQRNGNFSVCDPGGSKNVLTVGALGSFYDEPHYYYIRSYNDSNINLIAYSMVDPEPYMLGTLGTKELGSDIVVVDAGNPDNNCNTIDVPQITLLYASSADEFEWLFTCDIQKSLGILYTYDFQNLEYLMNGGKLVYMQDITPLNKSSNVTHAIYSSTGPANKGILKPDIMTPGTRIISAKSLNHSDQFHGCITTSGRAVTFMQGTSMATPNAAGAAALVRQYFRTNWSYQSVDLNGPTVRALLINSCHQQPVGSKTPNIVFGHGQVDLSTVLPVDNNFGVQITHQEKDQLPSIEEFSQVVAKLNVKSNSHKVQITMSYLDPLISPTSYIPITRDLDLIVVSSSGKVYKGDHLANNDTQHFSTNEKIIIDEDEIEPGEYTIKVYSLDFLDSPNNQTTNAAKQSFSVVATGDIDNGFLNFSKATNCGCESCDPDHPLHCLCDNSSFGEICQSKIDLMNDTLKSVIVHSLELHLVRIQSNKTITSIGLFTHGLSAETVSVFADTECHLNIGQFPIAVKVGQDKHATTNFDLNTTSLCVGLFNDFYEDTNFTIERDYVPPKPEDESGNSEKHHKKKKLSGGAIAGIVIACVVAVVIIVTTTVCCVKKQSGSIKNF